MTDARVAVALSMHTQGATLRARSLVDLLVAIEDAYVSLSAACATASAPVDPLMLNADDLEDQAALRDVVTTLHEDGALGASPSGGDHVPDRPLEVDQVERERPVFVELSGGPPLVLSAWLLTGLDGAFKITEEYAVDAPVRQAVHKRVSFTTSASMVDLVDALGTWPD